MEYISQDDNYNYWHDVIECRIVAKTRIDPYRDCSHRIIVAVREKYVQSVKLAAISQQVGISKYKVKKIIEFLNIGQFDAPVEKIVPFYNSLLEAPNAIWLPQQSDSQCRDLYD